MKLINNCENYKCLTDLVDFLGCNNNNCTKYIDTVAGMSEIFANNIYDSNNVELEDFKKLVKRGAYSSFVTKLKRKIADYYTPIAILANSDNPQTAVYGQKKVVIPQQKRFVGKVIEVPYNEISTFYLDAIYLNANNDTATTLIVQDLYNGINIYSEQINIKKGFNEIAVKKEWLVELQGGLVFIGIDQSTVSLNEIWCDEIKMQCGCDCNAINSSRNVVFGGCENINAESIFDYEQHNAICTKFEIKCNFDAFICIHKDLFVQAYLYEESLMYIQHAKMSTKRNWYRGIVDIASLETKIIPDIADLQQMEFNNIIDAIRPFISNSMCFLCDSFSSNSIIKADLV